MKEQNVYSFFRKALLRWHGDIDRNLPWKSTQDPYCIWISEIILQQTRVKYGRDYYLRFIERFPNLKQLADASEDEVLAMWQGLGYYSRARNLHHAAKQIVSDYSGVFPNQYRDILSLKGIGPYTAAAVSSFAFNAPHAVLDGNVYRVLSRVFSIEEPIDTSLGKKVFEKYAAQCLDEQQPGPYNQAIMDFGALLCTPKAPKCGICPLSKTCGAFNENIVHLLPTKSKYIKIRTRYLYFMMIRNEEKILFTKQNGNDIWKGLYVLPFIEAQQPLATSQVIRRIKDEFDISTLREIHIRSVKKRVHKLTHQRLESELLEIKPDKRNLYSIKGKWMTNSQINSIGIPRLIEQFLSDATTIDEKPE